jgi:hypothetical protein
MSYKKQPSKQRQMATEEEYLYATFKMFCGVFSLMVLAIILSLCGCTEQTKRIFKDAAVSVSDCAFHTSLACASQATAGCDKPSGGEGYGEFGKCLVNRSASCSGRGLGMCLLKGIANAIGTTSVAAGGVGCVNEKSLQEIESCVSDVTLETESEAVSAVAYCYRVACMGE